MVKRVDVAVVEVVKQVIDGTFRGGERVLGLAENGIGFVSDDRNRALLPPEVVAKAKGIAADIVAGKIEVPDR